MTRVLVVDDHDFLRGCLVDLVAGTPDLVVVGECRDGSEVVAAVRRAQPDVVLMDIRMGSRSGLEALADLAREQLLTRVVMLTSAPVSTYRPLVESLGAVGYLQKDAGCDQVLEAVRRVASGGTAWPEDLVPQAASDVG